MSSKILTIALSLILLLIAIFSAGCRNNSKQKNPNNNNPEPGSSLTLINLDSTSIKRCIEQTGRTDTIFSTTECAETISYLNNAGITVARKSIQHCMADTRMKWRVDSYFNDDSSSLDIFYDGVGNIVEVVRRSLPIVAKDNDSLRTKQKNKNSITIGMAMNAKDGAIIIADDKEIFYIDELGSWDAKINGKRVKVRGRLVIEEKRERTETQDLPQGITHTRQILTKSTWGLVK